MALLCPSSEAAESQVWLCSGQPRLVRPPGRDQRPSLLTSAWCTLRHALHVLYLLAIERLSIEHAKKLRQLTYTIFAIHWLFFNRIIHS